MEPLSFRHLTVLYGTDGLRWCDYLMKTFLQDNKHLKTDTLNVCNLNYSNPPEVQVAIKESHAVMLLITNDFINYMEEYADWFAPMLNNRDQQLTTIVAARLHVDYDDIIVVCGEKSYDATNWEFDEICSSGVNVKNILTKVMEYIDKNVENRRRRIALKEPKKKESLSKCNLCEMIPATVHTRREKVALLFTEQISGDVSISINSKSLPVTVVNPYCVTFRTPDLTDGGHSVHISTGGSKKGVLRLTFCKEGFTSLTLLKQSYGVETTEEVDSLLADQFRQSVCDDVRYMRMHAIDAGQSHYNVESKYATIAHWAAANGLRELCSAIISSPGGIDVCSMANGNGMTPADLAKQNGHIEIYDFIQNFLEINEFAEVCNIYVQLCNKEDYELVDSSNTLSPSAYKRPRAPTPQKDRTDDDEDNVYIGPEPPKSLLGKQEESLPPGKDPMKHLPSPHELFGAISNLAGHKLSDGAVGCRSQNELIEIMDEFKAGNFNMVEAEMLFNAWKRRNTHGQATSFRDKKKMLEDTIAQNTAAIAALEIHKRRIKKSKKEPEQECVNISEPILNRQRKPHLQQSGRQGSGEQSWSGSQRNLSVISNISTASSSDSGRDSNASAISACSSSTEDTLTEQFNEETVSHRNRTSSTTSTTSQGYETKRLSMKDSFLETINNSKSKQELPPPLPPRTHFNAPRSRTYSRHNAK